MQNREIVLNKIDAQEIEWRLQIRCLKSLLDDSEVEKRMKLEKYVKYLESKLKHISLQTNELRIANEKLWESQGEIITETWDELVHNVDYVISSYKKILSQDSV